MVKTRIEVSDEAWKIVTLVSDRDGLTKSEALERILRQYASTKPEFKEWLRGQTSE